MMNDERAADAVGTAQINQHFTTLANTKHTLTVQVFLAVENSDTSGEGRDKGNASPHHQRHTAIFSLQKHRQSLADFNDKLSRPEASF